MQGHAETAESIALQVLAHLTSVAFYAQLGMIVAVLLVALALASYLKSRIRIFREPPSETGALRDLRVAVHRMRGLLFPVLAAAALGIASPITQSLAGAAWMVQAAQGLALIAVVVGLVHQFVNNTTIVQLFRWVGIPVALLYAAGLLDETVTYLDSISIEIGNIRVTLYAALRTLIFGILLFWLGRVSSASGQRVIRSQTALDVGTREVIAKLFEIGIFVLIFLLLMNVMGIDLTALAVFGGALGVGLGFGLQQIASNFISGIIILLDRSITIGDYIELEDGRAGTLRELTMRSATLETYDGKDIMVPNERFITTAFVNWTHNNKKQRYSLTFQVAYKTDLEKLFDIVRETVASHPKVLSGDDLPIAERPDAEIESIGDSGVNILVEFWMDGIDDGENRVGADLLLMIWTALRANGIEFPFPQREVRVLDEVKTKPA